MQWGLEIWLLDHVFYIKQNPFDEQLLIHRITAQYDPARSHKEMIMISAGMKTRKWDFESLASDNSNLPSCAYTHKSISCKIKCSVTQCPNNIETVTFNTLNRLAPANSQRFSVYSCVGVYAHEGQCRPFLELVFLLFVTVCQCLLINFYLYLSQFWFTGSSWRVCWGCFLAKSI